jgi:glyoxylase-like metal-dependent hydrolase (beta-lactamase superfamily II)
MSMNIEAFFDKITSTITYIVYDAESRDAIVIDPVLDYSPAASQTWTDSVDRVVSFLKQHKLTLHLIMETHAHADHLSGSQMIKAHFPEARIAIGNSIVGVQVLFKKIFDLPDDFPTDGSQFDRLFYDGEKVQVGSLAFEVIFTPGHTPACASYRFQDAIFTGDALFMPDIGTGRCDFPGGDARDLYRSVKTRLYTLPDDLNIFVGHDYQPEGRALKYKASISQHKKTNVQLPAHRSLDSFIEFRSKRDAQLSAPKLFFQSVQVNADAGNLPSPDKNMIRYFKIPINIFRPLSQGEIVLNEIVSD